jgi:hypothetical protein
MAEHLVAEPLTRETLLFSDRDAVMKAIEAPEKITDRKCGDDWTEHMAHWQARAVLLTLSQRGLLAVDVNESGA